MSSEGPASADGASSAHPVSIPGCPPFRMRTHRKRDDFISRDIAETGSWEPLESTVVLERLRPGSVFVDVGANIGYYTVLASLACGPGGRVHAFEPEPGNFALLEENVVLNSVKNAVLVNAAVGSESGHGELFLSENNQGDHRLYRNESRNECLRVRTVSLDDWFGARPERIDLVKVDTQGCEARIVAGMAGLLDANHGRMSLILEYWPFGLLGAGDSPEALVGMLEPHGFTVHKIVEGTPATTETSWTALLAESRTTYHPDTQAFTNLLLTPR